MSAPNKKVAIVADWLIGGGAELVVEQLHKLYPDAPIYTSYATDEWRKRLDNKVVTGWLQQFGGIRKFIPLLRVWWFSRLNLSGYDLVISSSGAEAKFVKTNTDTLHIAYIHAPTHYYWGRYDEYLRSPGFGAFNWLARLGLRVLVGPLRKLDYRAAQRPNYLLTNSVHTAEQIEKYYDRSATVIYPPVDTGRFKAASPTKRNGFVTAGRQVPYKRIDLAVEVCTKLGLPLTVIGKGPDHTNLVNKAGPTITFITNATDKDIVHRFQSAEGFIFPGLEDFGIVAVEALAAGTPVVALRAGGSLDFVDEGKNGLLFEEQTSESLTRTLEKFKAIKWNHETVRTTSERYNIASFRKHITAFIDKQA